MSNISMEWLGGPIVLDLTQDEIMLDLEGDWTEDTAESVEATEDEAA